MSEFDQLPSTLRAELARSDHNFSVKEICEKLESGLSPVEIIQEIRLAELVIADLLDEAMGWDRPCVLRRA